MEIFYLIFFKKSNKFKFKSSSFNRLVKRPIIVKRKKPLNRAAIGIQYQHSKENYSLVDRLMFKIKNLLLKINIFIIISD